LLVLKTRIIFDGNVVELIQNQEVQREGRLELPSFSRLVQSWAKETGKEFRPPATVEEALEILRHNYCCRDRGAEHDH